MARTQQNRHIGVDTPLGEDVLLLRDFSYAESLGGMFEMELDMLSSRTDIDFDQIVGGNVTVRLNLLNNDVRYFNGYVCRFSQVGFLDHLVRYRATVVPWLWFLTRTSDCRIFQNKDVKTIIKEVFRENAFTDFDDRLSGSYRQWVYCVQYRETDFNFVSRLMEQEGIYYYFTHENGKHTLVLADSAAAHGPYPDYDEVPYYPPTEQQRETEHIFDWTIQRAVQPAKFSHTDFDFTASRTSLLATRKITRADQAPEFEIFDYPGEYEKIGDGETYARLRIEEIDTGYETCSGQGTARGLGAGFTFTLTNPPRSDQERNYLVTDMSLSASTSSYESDSGEGGGELFNCSFSAIDAQQPYRQARTTPKPVIRGVQTAMVVGPSGEEIYTDQYGRVKVQFHWDRYGESDEKSSCWIRVAQIWAGKKWGGVFLPRIGQEVIVEFEEGDPDRPIITGRVYNGQAMPPYDLPANKTQSGVKSRSSKDGSHNNFNEIRFEDKKDSEQILIHAEKDLSTTVENDETRSVGHDRTTTIDNDEDITVKGNRTEKVEKNEDYQVVGERCETVDGNRHLVVKKEKFEKVTGDKHILVTGNHNERVAGKTSLETTEIHQKVSSTVAVDSGQQIHLKAGMNIVVESGMEITLKAGANFIKLDPAGIAIQGTMVMLNSGGAPGTGSGASPTDPKDAKEAKTE